MSDNFSDKLSADAFAQKTEQNENNAEYQPDPLACYIALTNPKSPTNVGAVLRAAGCFNANGVYYSGSRYDRAAQFTTDTKNVRQKIPLVQSEAFTTLQPDCEIVCVDLIENAIPLPEFVHPEKALYVFGPEDGTISQQLVNNADHVIYIPTTGCLNLAATVNVILYDRMQKLQTITPSNQLIRKSRDTNNRVKRTAEKNSDDFND